MMRRGRKTLIALDSGAWCLARVIGRQHGKSGVRVRFVEHHTGEKYPTFSIAERDAGDGVAL